MNYQLIKNTIGRLGLEGDPSLDNTMFVLEKIPCDDGGCPLGLYDPNQNAIILPPNYLLGALIHEIGHRYGHYYYNDLTERYAEDFRKSYQTGEIMLVKRPGGEFQELPIYVPIFEPSDDGIVGLTISRHISSDELFEVGDALHQYGVAMSNCDKYISIQCSRESLPYIAGVAGDVIGDIISQYSLSKFS